MSSNRTLVIIAFLLLMLGGGLAIWNANRTTSQDTAESLDKEPAGPEMVGRNISFIITEGEVKKWKLEAVQAIYNEAHTEAHLKTVKGEFFDKDGKSVLHFTAPEGEYANQNNHVLLKGGVVATSTQENGGELYAPQMSWDNKAREVVASGGIELVHGQGKSLAQVCRFALDFSHITLQGGVTSTVSSP